MSDPHASASTPAEDEPKTPMWLPGLGAALFVSAGLWWAVTPGAPSGTAEPSASASASASAAPAQLANLAPRPPQPVQPAPAPAPPGAAMPPPGMTPLPSSLVPYRHPAPSGAPQGGAPAVVQRAKPSP